jgi:hypothetical protein
MRSEKEYKIYDVVRRHSDEMDIKARDIEIPTTRLHLFLSRCVSVRVCVCVYVCERERETEKETRNKYN